MCNIGPCPIPNSQDCPAKSIQIPHIQHFVHTPNPYRPSTHPIHAPSTVPTPIQPAPMYAQLAQPTHLPIPSLGPYAQPSHPAHAVPARSHSHTNLRLAMHLTRHSALDPGYMFINDFTALHISQQCDVAEFSRLLVITTICPGLVYGRPSFTICPGLLYRRPSCTGGPRLQYVQASCTGGTHCIIEMGWDGWGGFNRTTHSSWLIFIGVLLLDFGLLIALQYNQWLLLVLLAC